MPTQQAVIAVKFGKALTKEKSNKKKKKKIPFKINEVSWAILTVTAFHSRFLAFKNLLHGSLSKSKEN